MSALWGQIEKWGYFPQEVNVAATRIVALFVALIALATILFWPPLILLLPLGFFLRSWRGPQIDPLAKVALRLSPSEKTTPGSPKRFAQILGTLLSSLALLAFLLGSDLWYPLLGTLVGLALLEALGGICLGCKIFSLMMRRGWIPPDVCSRCAGSD